MTQITYTKNGTELMKQVLSKIVELEEYPSFDFINGVLTSKHFPEDTSLWLWVGTLKVCQGDCTGKRAGELMDLVGFEINDDNEFVFHMDEVIA